MSTTTPSTTLRQRLRHDTRRWHAAAEAGAGTATLEDPGAYRAWLLTQLAWHRVATAKLTGFDLGRPTLDQRCRRLTEDLERVGGGERAVMPGLHVGQVTDELDPATLGERLGWAYVLLGSQNGNGLLARSLRARERAAEGYGFLALFDPEPAASGWPALKQRLADLPADDALADAAARAATSAFAAYIAAASASKPEPHATP